MEPFCAAEFGARMLTSAPASSAANIMDFTILLILLLLLPRRTLPGLAGGTCPIILNPNSLPSATSERRPPYDMEWDPALQPPRMPRAAASSYRTLRRPCFHSDSTTMLDAAARPTRCRAG